MSNDKFNPDADLYRKTIFDDENHLIYIVYSGHMESPIYYDLLYWKGHETGLLVISDIIYEHGSLKEVKNVKQALDTIIENTGDLRETVDLHSEIIGDVEERLGTALNKVNQNTDDLRALNSKVENILPEVHQNSGDISVLVTQLSTQKHLIEELQEAVRLIQERLDREP